MSSPSANPNTITISNFDYSPTNLSVKPGTTITVVNEDSAQTEHTVTSESVVGAYTPGTVSGVQFNTGPITGTTTFTIPTTAVPGTVIPYFCTIHLAMMGPGQITIVAP
jgi:plastocyanin